MKGIILLSNGFEDTEAIATIDILKRGKLKIDSVSLEETNTVITQYNNKLITDFNIKELNYEEYDYLVIPGGKHVLNLYDNINLSTIIKYFYKSNKLIATICAAPSLLGNLGLLKEHKYTCFPSFEKFEPSNYTNNNVEISNNIITAKNMYYTIDFAFEILNYFEKYEEIKSIKASFL